MVNKEFVDLVEGLVTVQRTGKRVVAGFEFVETPPQPVLSCCPILDQGLSVVDQQPQFTRRAHRDGQQEGPVHAELPGLSSGRRSDPTFHEYEPNHGHRPSFSVVPAQRINRSASNLGDIARQCSIAQRRSGLIHCHHRVVPFVRVCS